MLKKNIKNIKNDKITREDIKYIWNIKDSTELIELIEYIKTGKNTIKLETNIYYPLIYQIENNCPTCGYRTPLSRQKYTQEFITKNIEYKLKDLKQYPISGINCYNKDITGLRELFIILDYLKLFDIKINVAVSNYKNLKELKKYDLNSIIISPEFLQQVNVNKKDNKKNEQYYKKVIKYIKEDMHLKVSYLLTLNYNESYHDIFNIIMKINSLEIDSVELRGFDPFIDSPEEYNPQYSKEYIVKIILLIKLYLPNVKIKIQYATNDINYIEDYLKLEIDTITGVYTQNMYNQLENINKIMKILKK